MGYRIVYGSAQEVQTPKGKSTARFRTLIAAAFLLFALTVRMTWREGRQILTEFLVPGDRTVAEQAFSELVWDLRSGEGIVDALTVFCRVILNEGP